MQKEPKELDEETKKKFDKAFDIMEKYFDKFENFPDPKDFESSRLYQDLYDTFVAPVFDLAHAAYYGRVFEIQQLLDEAKEKYENLLTEFKRLTQNMTSEEIDELVERSDVMKQKRYEEFEKNRAKAAERRRKKQEKKLAEANKKEK